MMSVLSSGRLVIFGLCMFLQLVYGLNTPRPPLWPPTFRVNFTAGGYAGVLRYDWPAMIERIDYDPGSFECVHFYNTTDKCILFFSKTGLHVMFRSGKCCLDVPGLGPHLRNWTSSTAFSGFGSIDGHRARYWKGNGPSYWDSVEVVSGYHVPLYAVFPKHTANQSMRFRFDTFHLHVEASLMRLPSNCDETCRQR
jgi:hypothetical protein